MFDINKSQKHTQQNLLNVNNQDLTNMFNINIGQTLTLQNFLRAKQRHNRNKQQQNYNSIQN